MDPTLTTVSSVIDRLGGNTPVARLTERKPPAVSNWRRFNAFPPDTYVALRLALEEIGESAPISLWGMVGERVGT